jgi:hypothetical protein
MRENRTYGSEGGEGKPFPTPIKVTREALERERVDQGLIGWRCA